MSDEATPKEYKYELKAGDFEILLSKTDDVFKKAKECFSKKQIGGLSRNCGITSLVDTEIKGSIDINNFNEKNILGLRCVNSKIKYLNLKNSNQNNVNSSIQLYFNKCNIHTFYVKNITLEHIEFTECDLHELNLYSTDVSSLNLMSSDVKIFLISRFSKISTLYFSDSLIGTSVIKDTNIENTIDISNCHLPKISFNRVSGFPYLDIENSSTTKLSFYDCSFQKLKISLSIFDLLDIYKSEIKQISTDKLIATTISINQSTIETYDANNQCASLVFSKATINRVLFQKRSHIPKLVWETGNEMEFYFNDNGVINSMFFNDTSLSSKTLLSFSNSAIHSISFDNFSVLGNLFFRQILLAKQPIDFPELDNINKSMQHNTELDEKIIQKKREQHEKCHDSYKKDFNDLVVPTIKISNSSLLKIEFTDFPLGEFRIEFNNSKITDCFVSGGSIPTENVHIINAESNPLKEHEQKASFFNQFKKVFEAQGDIYHATQFQAKWAEEQRKELGLRKKEEYISVGKKKYWLKVKIFFNSTSNDISTLWLNKISNLHGESWVRTLGVFFCIIIPVIYLGYLASIGRVFINSEFDSDLIWKYFEFLNPAHNIKFIDETKEVRGIAILIDFFGRIVVAYAIYQFIAAFRKHTKKK